MQSNYRIIDFAPANHIYTGGMLCNLLYPNERQMADFLCGELTYDKRKSSINWYHWDGLNWTKRLIDGNCAVHVGMAASDLTGNGKADLICPEWVFDFWENEDTGSIYWFEQPADPFRERWVRHTLARGWRNPHDLVVGNISGQGTPDVLVRDKDGRICWYRKPEDPRCLWFETPVAERQHGDGTALYDVTGSGCCDIVTGTGYYENVEGNGRMWRFHEFESLEELEMDAETRVAAGDLMGDGSICVIISESEILSEARIVLLHSTDRGKTWTRRILVDRERNMGAIHTLQLKDTEGKGKPDLFAAEMEVWKEETGIVRRPRWILFRNKGDFEFEECTVLDENLGAHMGGFGNISQADRPDFVAKNWHANSKNGFRGRNHIVHVSLNKLREKD